MPDPDSGSPDVEAERQRAAAHDRDRPSRLGSLAARITMLVVLATVVAASASTFLSVVSMDSFLRAKIDRKFPDILSRTSERLELWYEQRGAEMAVFAASSTLVDNVRRIVNGARGSRRDQALSEIEQYLRYVLESSPQYLSAYVLDARGRTLARGGEKPRHTDEVPTQIRERARSTASTPLYVLDGGQQVSFHSIEGPGGERIGSIHALLDLRPLADELRSEDLGSTGSIFVIDQAGDVVLGAANGGFDPDVLQALGTSTVIEYQKEEGEWVGSARAFPRFGWTVVVEESRDQAFAPSVAAVQRVIALNALILAGLVAGGIGLARTISKPIHALAESARRIAQGDREVDIPAMANRDEVGLLARTFAAMLGRLAANQREIERSHSDVENANRALEKEKRELQRANEVLEQLSITDGLTKLHNHRYFQEQLHRETARADRSNEPLSLILLDIDHFKRWNDRFGHATGDEILRRLAAVLGEQIRETDVLARYGGEEFAILLLDTALDGAVALAEKLRAAVASSTLLARVEGVEPGERVTISIGVSLYHGNRKAFFNDADDALYRAKHAGRDCVLVAEDFA